MPFHLNVVYFQCAGKDALGIKSFVSCPLIFTFFFFGYLKITYFIYDVKVLFIYSKNFLLGEK